MRTSLPIIIRVLWVSAALLCSSGCTITSDGAQTFEVSLDDVLPPSRVVASYRQLNKPVKMKDDEIIEQYGGKERLDIVDKWTRVNTVYSDYGIPERPPKARISVTEITNKQSAYGAYSNLRPSDLSEKSYVKVGVHGTVIDDRLFFVQDKYLIIVRDLANTPEPGRRTMLINFGYALSARLPRDITDIALVGFLPYENRVPASERLDKEDPLGMNIFKSGAVTAAFKIESKDKKERRDCKVFLADAKDKGGSGGLLKSLKKEFTKEGGKVEDLGFCEEGFTCTFNGGPAMMARRENVVFGCFGTYNEKEMKALMSNIDRRIKPYVPPKIKENKDPAEDEAKKKKAT